MQKEQHLYGCAIWLWVNMNVERPRHREPSSPRVEHGGPHGIRSCRAEGVTRGPGGRMSVVGQCPGLHSSPICALGRPRATRCHLEKSHKVLLFLVFGRRKAAGCPAETATVPFFPSSQSNTLSWACWKLRVALHTDPCIEILRVFQ